MKCPYCNHDLDPPSDVPEPPHDNAGDGLAPCQAFAEMRRGLGITPIAIRSDEEPHIPR